MLLRHLCVWGGVIAISIYLTLICLVQSPPALKSKPTQAFSHKTYPLIKENEKILEKGYPLPSSAFDKIRKNSETILKNDPLNDDVFLQLAVARYLQKDRKLSLDLLRTSQARNSRNRVTIKNILQQTAHSGDFEGFLKQIDLLYRLDKDNVETYSGILDQLYTDSLGRNALLNYLQNDPKWAATFLARKLSQYSKNIGDISEVKPFILKYLAVSEAIPVRTNMIKAYIRLLLERQNYNEAYEFWKKYGGGQSPSDGFTYNADFKKLSGTAPFNWNFFYRETGGTEYDQVGGAFSFFSGGKPEMLAQQYFPVPLGVNLELFISTSGNYSELNGSFEWRIICRPLNKLFFTHKVNASKEAIAELKVDIPTIPEACTFMELQLFGLPGSLSGRSFITLNKVSVRTKDRDY